MPQPLTLITGNQHKADQIARLLNIPLEHRSIDLEEIQSLDLEKIVRHKAAQAFAIVKTPVLVEDVSLRFTALNDLPGPFIKWFLTSLGVEHICRLLDGKERTAVATVIFSYQDAKGCHIFSGELAGTVPEHPAGQQGFGWDPLFIPEGHSKTRAEMDREEQDATSLRNRLLPQIAEFLSKRQPES